MTKHMTGDSEVERDLRSESNSNPSRINREIRYCRCQATAVRNFSRGVPPASARTFDEGL
jgi:hypothetical protein